MRAGQTEQVDSISSIAHQTTGGCGLTILKAREHSVPDRQGADRFTSGHRGLDPGRSRGRLLTADPR